MKIPVHERRETIAPLPGVRVGAHGGEAAYGGDAARGLGNFAAAGLRLAADLDDAKTLEAFNNFKKEVSVYHNDPNKGVLNKLGKETEGLYASADEWMSNKADEYLRKMPNARVERAFQKMAGGVITSQGEHNSRFEAKQIRAYRIAEADATIESAINDATENFADEAAVDSARDAALMALEVKTRGLGDEARGAALADLDDKIGTARLSRMIEADPLSAEAWFEEHKDGFSAPARAKAEAVLKQKTELYKTQIRVDELIKAFPPASEREALKFIRANFSGEEEEHLASAYKMRVNEVEVKRGNAEAGIRAAQNGNFDVLKREYWTNGQVPPPDMLGEMWDNGQINGRQYEQALKWNETFADRAKTRDYLQRTKPEFNRAEPEVQEQMILRWMGTSFDQYNDNLATISRGVLDGSMSEDRVRDFYNSGDITKYDAEALIKKLRAIPKAHQEAVRKQDALIKSELGTIRGSVNYIVGNGSAKGTLPIINTARSLFKEYVDFLDPEASDWNKQVADAKKRAVIDAISNSPNVKLVKEGYIWDSATPVKKRMDTWEESIENAKTPEQLAKDEETRKDMLKSINETLRQMVE
ncbi:hypothetical protein FACS1894187_04980 [Synergistales bacterium]|nr:hypothetical protein FACS1894187_04980 [Synergistales bacterium]